LTPGIPWGANQEFVIDGKNGAPFYTALVTAIGVFNPNVGKHCLGI